MNKMRKKIVTVFLSVAMIVTFMSVFGVQTAFAEDETEPAPIKDLYTINGINYYNAGSDQFNRRKDYFYRDLLLNGSDQLDSLSTAELWLEVAAGMLYGKTTWEGRYAMVMDQMAREAGSYSINMSIDSARYTAYKYVNYQLDSNDMKSLKDAEEYVYRVTGMKHGNGYFKNNGEEQVVIPAAIRAVRSADSDSMVAAVYFSNFRVTPILPEDDGKNYVTVENVRSKSTPAAASVVRNNSASEVTGSQTVSSSYTTSIQNTVGGSFTHSYQEAIKASNEFESGFFNKFTLELTFTFQQIIENNWSDTTAQTTSESTSRSISVNLPPYTSVMMTQKTIDAESVTTYNCPIGINFDATIVIYNKEGNVAQCSPDLTDLDPNNRDLVFRFGGGIDNARTSLKERYTEYKNNDNSKPRDHEGVNWYFATHLVDDGDYLIVGAMDKAMSYVPMSPAGGVLTEKLNMVENEVDGILPTLPLRGVMLLPMDVPFIVNDGSYNSYNFLKMRMPIGESTYTGYFKLGGYNARNVEYYGFSRAYGYWAVVDENEDEWTGDDAPVEIVKDTLNAWPKVKAVRPGTCYLKYFIDDNIYNTADHPDVFTTNDELLYTAIIEIEVPDDRTIDVDGQFEGYVDEEPEALDGDGKLEAVVCDGSGKELNDTFDVTWEAKERNGISVTDGNMVSFTKPGTYHVRACLGDIKSAWVEVSAKQLTFDVTFRPGNGRSDETVTVAKGQAVSEPSLDPDTCETFIGWFTDADCTQEADISMPVTENKTLYGKWEIRHDLISVLPISVEPACDGGGVIEHYKCRTCGKRFSDAGGENEISQEDTLTPAGHHMKRVSRQAPTCTKLGNKEYYICNDCGRFFEDRDGTTELSSGDLTIPALGHSWTEWEITKEPTEDEEGEETRYCRNDPDNHIQTRTIPALGHRHKMVKTPGRKPTCTEEGNRMYYTCSECGWVFTDYAGNNEIDPLDTVIPATGHKWDDGTVTKKATTQAEGEMLYTCSACGETKTEIIPKLPKKANPLKVSAKTATVRYSKLVKKDQLLKRSKVISITKKGKGTMKYTLSTAVKGSKSYKRYFRVNSKTGKVTVKKRLKKGTYKVKVKVKAAGNTDYKAVVKTVTFKVIVK